MDAVVRRWLFPVWCLGCARIDIALCTDCAPSPADRRIDVVAQTAVTAAGSYTGVLRRAIIAMKHGERAYLDPLAGVLAANVPSGRDIALIPLPTSRRRRAARGFDQAIELARRVAARTGVLCADVLEKRGAAQRGLNRFARLQAEGRFRIKAGALPARAVLIDDVCTTGATLSDAIRTLRAAGVAISGAVVLARAGNPGTLRP